MQSRKYDFDQRIVTARRLFHENGDVPRQLVSDTVMRSWLRSQQAGLSFSDQRVFSPVSPNAQRRLEEANRAVLVHAEPEMQRLFAALGSANWAVSFIDAEGFVIRTVREYRPAFEGLAIAFRSGVNLSETGAGTTGPACALAERRPSMVCGHEHFLDEAREFTCSSAPVFDPAGRLVGVLNASHHYDDRSVSILEIVAAVARAIENRMVKSLRGPFHFNVQYCGELAGAHSGGLLAFAEDGRLLGANPFARQLMGIDEQHDDDFSAIFGSSFSEVIDALRRSRDVPLTIEGTNGILVQARLDPGDMLFHPKPGAKPLRSGSAVPPSTPRAVYTDPAFAPVLARAQRAFAQDVPILINGETGTGKEILARQLHDTGPRSNGPFIAINCSSIPPGLIESELFGYENGAFTGASRKGMVGKVEQAHGGTLFLDEIGDMPLELQARLLRVLQERELTRVGGSRNIALEFSLICATHRDLAGLMVQRAFREDLYFRIKGLRIELPPLRLRADLDALIDHMLRVEAGSRAVPHLSARARMALKRYPWPGNLRELCQTLRLGISLSEDGKIDLAQLPEELTALDDACCAQPLGPVERFENEAIREAFKQHRGNISAMSRALGMARATVYRKLRLIGLLHAGGPA